MACKPTHSNLGGKRSARQDMRLACPETGFEEVGQIGIEKSASALEIQDQRQISFWPARLTVTMRVLSAPCIPI